MPTDENDRTRDIKVLDEVAVESGCFHRPVVGVVLLFFVLDILLSEFLSACLHDAKRIFCSVVNVVKPYRMKVRSHTGLRNDAVAGVDIEVDARTDVAVGGTLKTLGLIAGDACAVVQGVKVLTLLGRAVNAEDADRTLPRRSVVDRCRV